MAVGDLIVVVVDVRMMMGCALDWKSVVEAERIQTSSHVSLTYDDT